MRDPVLLNFSRARERWAGRNWVLLDIFAVVLPILIVALHSLINLLGWSHRDIAPRT
jgi:hypothetical protein